MPLILPALALFGLFGFFTVSEQRRREGKAPGVVEGWPSAMPHSHEALLPLELGSQVLWVTPRHPLWFRAVAYHMGLCLAAQRLRGGGAPLELEGLTSKCDELDLGDGGPSALARAANVERPA
jgi:hypothetical protein